MVSESAVDIPKDPPKLQTHLAAQNQGERDLLSTADETLLATEVHHMGSDRNVMKFVVMANPDDLMKTGRGFESSDRLDEDAPSPCHVIPGFGL